MYEHIILDKNSRYYSAFREEFIESFLKFYDFCITIEGESSGFSQLTKLFKKKTLFNSLSSLADFLGMASGGGLKSIGEESAGKAAQSFVSGAAKAGIALYFIVSDFQERKVLAKAKNFLNLVDRDRKNLENTLSALIDILYFRYQKGIHKLSCEEADYEGVRKLANFFANAIARNLQNAARTADKNELEFLLSHTVPPEGDTIYSGLIGRIKLKMADNNDHADWTIEGFLIRSKFQIYGEKKIGFPKDCNEKYEVRFFQDAIDLKNSSLEIQYPKHKVKDITTANSAFTSTLRYFGSFFNSECTDIARHEEDLRFLTVNGDMNYTAIEIALSEKININGRGLGNSVCSFYYKLFDRTPLMIATLYGQVNTAIYLIDNGANFNLIDCYGFTALDLAIETAKSTNKPELKHNCCRIAMILKANDAVQYKKTENEYLLVIKQDQDAATLGGFRL